MAISLACTAAPPTSAARPGLLRSTPTAGRPTALPRLVRTRVAPAWPEATLHTHVVDHSAHTNRSILDAHPAMAISNEFNVLKHAEEGRSRRAILQVCCCCCCCCRGQRAGAATIRLHARAAHTLACARGVQGLGSRGAACAWRVARDTRPHTATGRRCDWRRGRTLRPSERSRALSRSHACMHTRPWLSPSMPQGLHMRASTAPRRRPAHVWPQHDGVAVGRTTTHARPRTTRRRVCCWSVSRCACAL